jgi:hypothetical protein
MHGRGAACGAKWAFLMCQAAWVRKIPNMFLAPIASQWQQCCAVLILAWCVQPRMLQLKELQKQSVMTPWYNSQ